MVPSKQRLLSQAYQDISSWGVDFDLPQLREAHARLSCSRNFFYGDANELNISIPAQGARSSCSIRCVPWRTRRSSDAWAHSTSSSKEVSANPIMRHRRKNENDAALYAPARLARLFPAYRLERLYGSRFLFSVSRPSPPTLAVLRWMPTYTALLARR
jgi:hypothetical protein